jgi:uncharacterized protein YbjT (DUF2867 family)
MRVILFGATGMVGQGVLRECLADPGIERVLAIVRAPLEHKSEKIEEIVHRDFFDYSPLEAKLAGWDACFFCLGVSSAGMSEDDYRRVTYDLTLSVARTLASANPGMTFIYVTGAGTDSSERGRSMWARVKGETENALLRLPFKAAYMFRPAGIVPLHGITSKTRLYRIGYTLTRPFWPLLQAAFPRYVTDTERLGRAMLKVAKRGAPKPILETLDFNAL